ncbi:zinc-responsive transcriptional regulator [Haploplasma axanthum]|uniref:Zinc-responsive transcriptional regulator n=2 Tax=Haploplasma axanthum TaxID=29552 RepID=A0A449BDQ7_HAPAX|nr:zinc-responsive transcriptional regulator [Haploplasma axanthum]
MQIGDLAKKTNKTIDTLRYYQSLGLIESKKKGKNYYFTTVDINIIEAIDIFKNIGLSLSDIKSIISLNNTNKSIDDYTIDELMSVKNILENCLDQNKKREENIKKSYLIINKMLEKLGDKIW